jgi:hypothetical protein
MLIILACLISRIFKKDAGKIIAVKMNRKTTFQILC